MSADPADIAKYTTDGVVVTSPTDPSVSAAIRAQHQDARSTGDTPADTFWDDDADAQILNDERFTYLRQVNPLRVAIEVGDSLGLGDTIPITPQVPCYTVIDGDRQAVCRVRAYALNLESDRYSVEVIQ